MNKRSKVVDAALEHAMYISESIEELAKSKDKSVLKDFGIDNDNSESSTDESTDDEDQHVAEEEEEPHDHEETHQDVAKLVDMVRSSLFNYFDLHGCSSSLLELVKPYLTQEENKQLLISYDAFCLDEELNANIRLREVNAIKGEIVTDSKSDDANEICHVSLDDSMKALVQKKRKSIKRQASRLKAKLIAEQNFLRRKVSRKVRGIVKEFPDIGHTIEEFVKENHVGADQWRRTGVLTFDGNVRNAKRVTYERIRQHLVSVYKREFSYGTTVRSILQSTEEGLSKLNTHPFILAIGSTSHIPSMVIASDRKVITDNVCPQNGHIINGLITLIAVHYAYSLAYYLIVREVMEFLQEKLVLDVFPPSHKRSIAYSNLFRVVTYFESKLEMDSETQHSDEDEDSTQAEFIFVE